LFEAIKLKFQSKEYDELAWPVLESTSGPDTVDACSPRNKRVAHESPTRKGAAVLPLTDRLSSSADSQPLRSYWQSLQRKHSENTLLAPQDLSSLPTNWVVISVNVTADKTTMFVSRHQANHEPIVFCLPLDRQGKREGEAEEELFTFDAAVKQLTAIIDESNSGARDAKHVVTKEAKEEWWQNRHNLDNRMKELVETMEFCWLGAFKVGRRFMT
jgi:separase